MVVAITVTSCIPSLFPLYKKSDLKTDDRLSGIWQAAGDDYTWEVMSSAASKETGLFGFNRWQQFDSLRTYRLISTRIHDQLESQFAVHLLELNDQDYLNYYPVDWEVDHDFLNWHLVETNIFSKVDIRKDTLIVYFFDTAYLDKLIMGNRIKISHVRLDDRILLTAPTSELQQFVIKYGTDPGAFIKPDTLIRISR
jgi:hypothetical protein